MGNDKRRGRRFLALFFVLSLVGVLITYRFFLQAPGGNFSLSLRNTATNEELTPLKTPDQTDQSEPGEVSVSRTISPVNPVVDGHLLLFEPESVQELQDILDQVYEKDSIFPNLAVNLAPKRFPPGLAGINLKRRKSLFIKSLFPIILFENRQIDKDRDTLLGLKKAYQREGKVEGEPRDLLKQLMDNYSLSNQVYLLNNENFEEVFSLLEKRIDTIPPSLAVAQAAIESGWGTSRFLLEGNNLFGQWTFNSKKGIIPAGRPPGATYRVASFASLSHSVRSYLKNLNTGWAYRELREQRAEQRRQEANLNPLVLAGELRLYSIRREAYVKELAGIIKANNLQILDDLSPHVYPIPEAPSLTVALLRERGNEQID